MTSSAGDSTTHYGFTGERTDPSGLTYLRARYYNPTDGRFMNRDTWSGDVNNPHSLNRWNYVEGNPVNFVDPSGNNSIYMGISGYSEGYINSGVIAFSTLALDGYEIVYDFATLERALFHVSKRVDPETGLTDNNAGFCTSVYNLTDVSYTSMIYGLDHNDGIVNDFGGVSRSWSGGWSLVGFGQGVVLFSSVNSETHIQNWDVWGVSSYREVGIDASLFVVFEFGSIYSEYQLAEPVKKYPNMELMKEDILSGDKSPIFFGVEDDRKWAAEQAEHFEELWK